jgi:hypothetical protein
LLQIANKLGFSKKKKKKKFGSGAAKMEHEANPI